MQTSFDNLTTIETSEMTVVARRDEYWNTWVATADECITRDMYRVKKIAESGFKPERIVDLGAQTGMFTAMAGKYFPEAFIYAFEPILDWFRILTLNAPKRSMCVNACVLGHLDSPIPRAIDHTNGDEVKWRTGEPPEYAHKGISVSAMMALLGGPIDILKIDCEGSEVNIFRDMDGQGLILQRIEWIVGEYHFSTAKNEVQRILGKTHTVEMNSENELDFFWAKRRC